MITVQTSFTKNCRVGAHRVKSGGLRREKEQAYERLGHRSLISDSQLMEEPVTERKEGRRANSEEFTKVFLPESGQSLCQAETESGGG